MYGLLVYLPTIAFVPHWAFFFAGFYYIIKNRDKIFFKKSFSQILSSNLFILLIISFLGLLNRLNSFNEINSIPDFFPYLILSLLTYFISNDINEEDLAILIWLIFFESLILIVEYSIGVNTFFSGLENFKDLNNDSGLFYYKTAFGLSASSSIISYKILLGFLLIDFIKLKNVFVPLIKTVFIVALFMTFNRTTMFVMVFYIFLQSLRFSWKTSLDVFLRWKLKQDQFIILIFGLAGVAFVSYFFISYFNEIIMQLTRNSKTIELSGREEIWQKFFQFIGNHFFLGYGSKKYLVEYYSGPIHAHNSFIQMLANNGIVIFSIYLFLILKNIRKENFVFILTLFFYSLTQYGIFWGISLMDIILFVFLFNNFNLSPKNQKIIELSP